MALLWASSTPREKNRTLDWLVNCFMWLVNLNHEHCHFDVKDRNLDVEVIGGQNEDRPFL